MNWTDQTLEEYGRMMGIDGVSFNEHGVVCLGFESGESLFFEKLPEELLIYVTRKRVSDSESFYTDALSVNHWKRNLPVQVNVSMRGEDQVVVSARLKENEVNLSSVERVVTVLRDVHQNLLEPVGP